MATAPKVVLPPGADPQYVSLTREDTFDTFGCNVLDGNVATPDKIKPDVTFGRDGASNWDVTMADGKKVRFWIFKDYLGGQKDQFPSAPMRVRQGQVVHSTLKTGKGTHTIHHHGMNPTPFNDGVGHLSFEVKGQYTYQFQPSQAGTYFYHCHKNTVLHFEMGMYGLLIVDPPEGPGTLFTGGPKYDVEYFWVFDDVDPRWHTMDHEAGLCGDDVGLNRFEPKYFMITGVPSHKTKTDPKVKITAKVGQSILIRMLNASYSTVFCYLVDIDSFCFGGDGKPLGDPERPWAQAFPYPANDPWEMVTAQRRDIIVRPTKPGEYRVRVEFRHWITGEIQNAGKGFCETVISVKA